MQKNAYLKIAVLTFLFLSCNKNAITKQDIDNFISENEKISFSCLKNVTIVQRSSNLNNIVYAVGRYSGNLPVYIVTYSLKEEKVTKIDKSILRSARINDYLTECEIYSAIKMTRSKDFFLLAVDSLGNVFINPFQFNSPPYFLRLQNKSKAKTVRYGYIYELYKNNWYLNKLRQDN